MENARAHAPDDQLRGEVDEDGGTGDDAKCKSIHLVLSNVIRMRMPVTVQSANFNTMREIPLDEKCHFNTLPPNQACREAAGLAA
eukprot:1156783-Pelagomonas_calceolata.AAC.5